MGLSLCYAPTGMGNDGISPIIMSLVEDSPQARPTSINVQFRRFCKMSLVEDSPQARPTNIDVQFKRLCKIGIGKNGHHGTQVLQVIKGTCEIS